MDTEQKLTELLADFFGIGSPDGSYHYTLKRVKEAFGLGTMGLDDFEEYDEEAVADIVEHLIAAGVTIQQWIPVEQEMPKEHKSMIPNLGTVSDPVLVAFVCTTSTEPYPKNCVVCEAMSRNGRFSHKSYAGEYKAIAWMPKPKPPKEV
jgi:hypothetical protein